MKAVLMSGGRGTRLNGVLKSPFTNKHSLMLGDHPMIFYPVQTLVQGGVTEILVLLDGPHPESIMGILENGNRFGARITYMYVNNGQSPGLDLLMAETWVGKEAFIVMLGDSLFLHKLEFSKIHSPHIWVTKMTDWDDLSKYGQVTITDNRVTKLIIKPTSFFSDLIQTGVWKFTYEVFQYIRKMQKNVSGELHIGMISRAYCEVGILSYTLLPPNAYIDVGTPEAFNRASDLLTQRKP